MNSLGLCFNLPDEDDDWPPVTTECMPFQDLGSGRYLLLVAPLFVRDLSVGDVLILEVSAEGIVWEWAHEKKSRNSTVWVIDFQQDHFEDVMKKFLSLGCNVSRSPEFDVAAISVPENVDREIVEEFLDMLDEDSVGYPSYRHEE